MNDFYTQELHKAQQQLDRYQQKLTMNSWARGLVFLSTIVLSWWISSLGWYWLVSVLLSGLSVFVFLVAQSSKLTKQIRYYENFVKICREELDALEWNYASFDDGSEYLSAEEGYKTDLDLFGPGSVFQYLNRSCTFNGKNKLAALISNENVTSEEVEQRQLSVVELSELHDWRLRFRATGLAVQETPGDNETLNAWLAREDYFSLRKAFRFVRYLVPALTFSGIVMWSVGIIPESWFIMYLIVPFAVAGSYIKKVNSEVRLLGKTWPVMQKYAALIDLIEHADFKSKRLGTYQYSLRKEGHEAGKTMERLGRIIKKIDNRNNMLIGVLANLLYLSDLHHMFQLEKWRSCHKDDLVNWMEILSKFDAYSSLATYAANNPAYVYADVLHSEISIRAVAMGHPLLHRKERVCNDFEITTEPGFAIVTGANMAGKSTFLRTVGVNLLLAKSGAPVCAGSFAFRPMELFTSMRTSDSLIKHQSYFFAELFRLKQMITQLEQGQNLFVILDEVLKGTNSRDKALGSKALVRQLIRYKACGLIATHDISLGALEKEFPGFLMNKRFEVELVNDDLEFDYRLKEGISQNLNATFLMRKMGITVDDDE